MRAKHFSASIGLKTTLHKKAFAQACYLFLVRFEVFIPLELDSSISGSQAGRSPELEHVEFPMSVSAPITSQQPSRGD